MQSNSSINNEYIPTEYERKELNKNQVTQVRFSLLKRESNYLDRQRQWLLVCFAVMLSLGILSNILGVSGAFDPFFTKIQHRLSGSCGVLVRCLSLG